MMSSKEESSQAESPNEVCGNRRDFFQKKSSLKSLDGSSRRSLNSSVRFSSVAVRGYSLCIGDNPSVSRGIPISLDWEYDEENSYDINKYEDGRCEQRRDSEELKLPSLQRVQILKQMGYSRGEITDQTKEVQKIKDKRFSTRRRVERAERIKKLVRETIGCFSHMIPSSCPKKTNLLPCATNDEKIDKESPEEADEDTLASSISSKKSDLSTTDSPETLDRLLDKVSLTNVHEDT
eukprot:CAMPEP_0116127258 /NCGR_PEP_ID=MMETSP0329-20121206/6750_1 /TAXON_ID=697910 /ORGANISM="Pseudo-nitzschia arenysensis, Strain B593" /LENGTH=235 /DNA_ID=CAMNT_0003621357 /DNA_START=112 /DNA_END=819 /DNA_ORIENTATION=+